MAAHPGRALSRLAAGLGALLVGVAVVSRAWVAEDAYISFRVVDNFFAGHGLTWNVDERVQVYTHPLWLLLHLPIVAVTREYFFTTLAVSLACTLGGWALAARGAGERPGWILAVATALVASRAFVEFGTSGLETPLTYLCLAGFAVEAAGGQRTLVLAAWAGLLLTNRMDAGLFVGPALAVVLWRWHNLRALVGGMLPFLAWEAFSLVYYGFLVPNTSHAKLSTGIPAGELAEQGVVYLGDLVVRDPMGALLLALGAGLGLVGGVTHARAWLGREAAPLLPALGLGSLLYTLYVVRVGGDFMSGRFWAPGIWVGALLLLLGAPAGRGLVALVVAGLLALAFPRERPGPEVKLPANGIADERAAYWETNTLERYVRGGGPGAHRFCREGRTARAEGARARAAGDQLVVQTFVVGMMGFCAGPEVILVDGGALTDPLLARLPMEDPRWRPGHYGRYVPRGYAEYRRSGDPSGMDDDLARYVARLALVTRGPLLGGERWVAISGFMTGAWDADLDAYQSRRDASIAAREPAPPEEPTPIRSGGAVVFGQVPETGAGVEPVPWEGGVILLPRGATARFGVEPAAVARTLRAEAEGRVRVRLVGADGASGELPLTRGPGMVAYELPLPAGLVDRGIVAVELVPEGEGAVVVRRIELR